MTEFNQDVIAHALDILHVGAESERSGDALACQYTLGDGTKRVVVIDGGTKESGTRLVELIKKYYGTDIVDHVVSTHADQDHASGLTVVLEQLKVGKLWMHRPWEHADEIRDLFRDGRMTASTLADRIKEGLSAAWTLEQLANERGIPIEEPFQGMEIGRFVVLSPSRERYQTLVPQFSATPAAKVAEGALSQMFTRLKEVVYGVAETHDVETLSHKAETSASNESSVCLLGFLGWDGLFTGDAGTGALTEAADYAERRYGGSVVNRFRFVQVPHHGSRNNVTPPILDRILGTKIGQNDSARGVAVVSAGGLSKTHPRRVVSNAFRRRGYPVATAKTTSLLWHKDMPREGYGDVETLPHFTDVESD